MEIAQKMKNDKISVNLPLLDTERLLLRHLTDQDITEVYLLRSDPEINKYLDRSQSQTVEDSLKFINAITSGYKDRNVYYWAISIRGNKKLVGTIGIFDINDTLKSGEIGFELLP